MKKRILSLLMVGAMTAGMLAGCGSKTDAPADNTAKEETPATEEAKEETPATEEKEAVEPVTLNVAYMPNYGSLWSVENAIAQGYLEEEGITVNLVEFQDGPTIISAMESGSIDVGYIGQGAHKLCINGQATIFALSHISNGDALIGGEGITSIEDLKGKQVAYSSGTSSEDILVNSLTSVGLTMDDIEAYDMEVSNMVSAMVSGSVDACAAWSPSSSTIVSELGDDAQIFCTNTTFADEAADCEGWVCMPGYVEANSDILVRFTKALYEAMDYGSQEANYDEVAGYVAEICGTDKAAALEQTGDGAWLDSKTLLKYLEDGTLKHYYEVQQKNFIDAGDIDKEVPVEDYVLFDIMEEADK